MQPFGTTDYKTPSSNDSTVSYLERLFNAYGHLTRLDGNRFYELAKSQQPQSGSPSYLGSALSNAGGFDNVDNLSNLNTIDTPLGAALREGFSFGGIYYGDANDQIARQELQDTQRQARDEAQRAEAIAESQRVALEPKPDPMMDETAFGQSRIRNSVLNKGPQAQQPLEVMKAIAQRAQSRAATLRRVQMPKRPDAQ